MKTKLQPYFESISEAILGQELINFSSQNEELICL